MKFWKRLWIKLFRLNKIKKQKLLGKDFKLNLLPSKVDSRDLNYSLTGVELLPPKAELSVKPIVRNQGSVGDCGSFAICQMMEILSYQSITKLDDGVPLSERFHYYEVRQPDFMNTFPKDSGQYLRDGCKVCAKIGVSPEKLCPYVVNQINVKPGFMAFGFSHMFRLSQYNRCFDVNAVKTAISQNKPAVMGIQVTADIFNTPKDGNLRCVGKVIGGHALCVIAYDDTHKNSDNTYGALKFVNSWGTNWGNNGFGWISYPKFTNYLIEAWTGIIN